jgi:hypothetical protein
MMTRQGIISFNDLSGLDVRTITNALSNINRFNGMVISVRLVSAFIAFTVMKLLERLFLTDLISTFRR